SVQPPIVAMPDALVLTVADPVIEPPPAVTAKVTLAPTIGFELLSRTSTLGAVATAVLTVAVWLLPALMVIDAGTAAVPVAEKVAGLPVSAPLVAVSVLAPAMTPSVHPPMVAIPDALVCTVAGPVIDPPPLAT